MDVINGVCRHLQDDFPLCGPHVLMDTVWLASRQTIVRVFVEDGYINAVANQCGNIVPFVSLLLAEPTSLQQLSAAIGKVIRLSERHD
jgi:hypothetical protein